LLQYNDSVEECLPEDQRSAGEFKIQDGVFKIQDGEFKIQDGEFKIQDGEFKAIGVSIIVQKF